MTRYFRRSRKFRSRGVRWNVENELLFGSVSGNSQANARLVVNGSDGAAATRTSMTVKNFRVDTSIRGGA